MRFSKAGTTTQGTEFDFVVRDLDTRDKYTVFKPELNGPDGKGFDILIGVTADDAKPVHETEFEFSFEDEQGHPVAVDAVNLYLLDVDRDLKQFLREVVCYNLDSLDLETSQIPGFDAKSLQLKAEDPQPGFEGTELLTSYNETHNCDGSSATTLGSVRWQAIKLVSGVTTQGVWR